MKNYIYSIFFIIFCNHFILAQDSILLKDVRNSFESFEYSKVIKFSEQLLLSKSSLTINEIIELFLMKGISHYTLADEGTARKSFIEILKLNSSYSLDSNSISPKIISFYESIRNDFLSSIEKKNEAVQTNVNIDSILTSKDKLFFEKSELYKFSSLKSILIPGLGHLDFKKDLKSWILFGSSTAALGSMIYFIFNTNKAEKNYLNETNLQLIPSKYDAFNSSYKIRNILITAYILIWAYSQLDFFFLSDFNLTSAQNTLFNNFTPSLPKTNFNFSMKFYF